jgi:molybdate transport system regulatory protein
MSAPKRAKLRARSKVWLTLGDRPVFGDGKARLLEQVDRSGSLKAAAEALGMSYRGLWGRLSEMERRLGMKLLVRKAGGAGGGGSRLTASARRLLERYRRFRDGLNALVDARFEDVFGA